MKKISPDVTIFIITLILVGVGVVMVYSASAIMAAEKFNDPYFFLKKQLCWTLLGLVSMVFFMHLDYRILEKFIYPLFFFSIFLLVLVLIPKFGRLAGGARRWVKIGPVVFQPSELVKLFLIIYLASSLSRKNRKIEGFTNGFLPYLIIIGVIFALIMKQPDFGTAVLLVIISMTMLFISGARMMHILASIICSLPFFYLFVYKVEYRRERVLSFLNPWEDPLGKGFHTIQSLIAMGSGGTTGFGLGGGRQKLFYLPAPHTDFIFSVIGEEFGFVGTGIIIFLFLVFLWQGYRIAAEAREQSGSLLAAGITFLIVFQSFINMGVVSGMLPVKGVPLPFISFGGSSLIFTMSGVGILLSVWRHRKKVKNEK
ncbi:stage V sporulation protein E [Candidatus Desantisbacteria bacterium CG1_02_38_46]|uniref:Probable peptidoglycan glycosyltransferase FtsW n=3 Tax=unclassified Candidatus Desantisiibacteriota TaxID=3106372 RepID=A0A2H9PAF3_9BACT|nr:MAG: stage V sporulation protein E [Candidatus Desantisbacteria bacterium CG1_02_38_46]PIU51385.1 MAG: stage V sporulation protein E [Candidatus Desantisbacteria bacterium CG07_land_8_20_14_0_80_39_15]PIZ15406.1 MAG: stage V sporulation protein E [Candidatus Desantisbacteria bacterium CG_4_10_14_0_8_um_filter_39_17]